VTYLLDDRTATWARGLIRAGREHGPAVVYGSDEWWTFDAGHPRRLAAIIVAAESHRHTLHPDVIAEDLRTEMAAQEWLSGRLLVEAGHDVALGADWPAIFGRATYAELCDRRGEPEKAERARARLRGVA
jgi:hypothetical protein